MNLCHVVLGSGWKEKPCLKCFSGRAQVVAAAIGAIALTYIGDGCSEGVGPAQACRAQPTGRSVVPGGNWNGAAIPIAADIARFGSVASVNLTPSFDGSVNNLGLNFQAATTITTTNSATPGPSVSVATPLTRLRW